jgi:hypothetical protein
MSKLQMSREIKVLNTHTQEVNKLWLMDDFKNYKIMLQHGQADGQMHAHTNAQSMKQN